MKTAGPIFILIPLLALIGFDKATGQWAYNGNDIYNTNPFGVSIGNGANVNGLWVGKNMTEPTITVRNFGGSGGATYSMIDDASGANWKFKATNIGGFKIRDHGHSLDVFIIEPNSAANAFYIDSAGSIGIGTNNPASAAILDINSTNKGFLGPRMTSGQINTISNPANGLSVYNSSDDHLYAYSTVNNAWNRLAYDAAVIIPFQCGQPYTDIRDSHVYNTVQIGSQCWMKSNLNYGSMIPASQTQSNNQTLEKYCYSDDPAQCSIWGALYQWGEMMNYTGQEGAQGICPAGWHVPKDAEWCTLATFLDATVICQDNVWSGTDAGGKMKETGTTHWWSPNTGATNSSGFTGIGAGYSSGGFNFLYSVGHWWTSSTVGSNHPLWMLRYQTADIGRWEHPPEYGFSARCVKD